MSKTNNTLYLSLYDSPTGAMLLASVGEELCLVDWQPTPPTPDYLRRLAHSYDCPTWQTDGSPLLEACERQLSEYFRGDRRNFDLPLRLYGTPFEQMVWQALCQIPYGHTLSYGQFTERITSAKSIRAVAGAIGRNPLSIFVPCHRIVGSDSLGGFSAGLEVKRRLLALEQGFTLEYLPL